jgi:hypothetical protein
MATNLFSQFRRLLPAQPLLVGEVVSSGGGAVVVMLPGGDEIVVRGDGTVGTNVFVRNGMVEGAAPDLTVVLVEV